MRLNLLNTTLSGKLENRVTLERFKHSIEKVTTKVNGIQTGLETNIEDFEKLKDEMEDYIKLIEEIKGQLAFKIELDALKPLWKHFDRFSLYDDLKQLHNKVMPELVKFEDRLINFYKEIDNVKAIVK